MDQGRINDKRSEESLRDAWERYCMERRSYIDAALQGRTLQDDPPTPDPKWLDAGKGAFSVLCVEIDGSLPIDPALGMEPRAQIVSMFQAEMAECVRRFKGIPVNRLAKGIIACFPSDGAGRVQDNAFDCALTMEFLTRTVIAEELETLNLGRIDFRLGLDSDDSRTNEASRPEFPERLAATVDLAKSIQSSAPLNRSLMGEFTFQRVSEPRPDYCHLSPIRLPTGGAYNLYEIVSS